MGTRFMANQAGFITDSKEVFTHQSKTSDGLIINHIGVIVEYPHPLPRKGVYHAVYMSIPADVRNQLDDEDLAHQYGVTFNCIAGTPQEVPTAYEAFASITDLSHWLGWDDMAQTLGAEELKKMARVAINLMTWDVNI